MRHYAQFGGRTHEINPHWRSNMGQIERMERRKVLAQMRELFAKCATEYVPGQANPPGLERYYKKFPKLAVQDLLWRVQNADARAKVSHDGLKVIIEDIEREHSKIPKWADAMEPVARRLYFEGIFLDPEKKTEIRRGVKTDV